MKKIFRTLFIISGLIPVLGIFSKPPTFILLIYSIFVWFYLFGQGKWLSKNLKPIVQVIFAGLCVLFLTESLAWLGNYFEGFKNPAALFDTGYFKNLAIGSGFYMGLAVVWFVLNKYFYFSTAQAFATYGLIGIFLEQKGAVIKQAALVSQANPALAILIVLFVFFVHGSILGLIHLRTKHLNWGKSRNIMKYPIAIIMILGGVYIGTAITGLISLEILFK